MPGFMPGIHAFLDSSKQGVDGRDKPGHDILGSHLGPAVVDRDDVAFDDTRAEA